MCKSLKCEQKMKTLFKVSDLLMPSLALVMISDTSGYPKPTEKPRNHLETRNQIYELLRNKS